MERTKNIKLVVIVFILLFPLFLSALTPTDCKYDFYEAYITGDMEKWEETLSFSIIYYHQTKDPEFLEQFIIGSYGFVPYLIEQEEFTKAKEYIEKANSAILFLENENKVKYLSFKGAFIAFEIGIDIYKAIYLGPRSMAYINESIELNIENPYGWLEKANAEYHMPRAFGGSYEDALKYYQKSINYFENQEEISHNWIYLNTQVWMAKTYEKLGQDQEAIAIYKRLLSLVPDFNWVKNELLPELNSKIL